MYFYKNLYVGSSIRDPEEVKKNLRIGRGQFTIYVIALSPPSPASGPISWRYSTVSILNSPIIRNILLI